MKITTYDNALYFLERNLDFLNKKEIENSRILGITLPLKTNDTSNNLYFDATINNKPQLAGLVTAGGLLIVAVQSSSTDLLPLVVFFKHKAIQIKEVIAPFQLSETFAHLWSSDSLYQSVFQIRHRLDELNPAIDIHGNLLKAKLSHIEKVAEWVHGFRLEAFSLDDKKGAYELTRHKIENNELYIWEREGKLVSMAGVARPTQNGITINYVYTPIQLRKNGFATQLVWKMSQLMLQKGYKFCTLITDASNPTANNIYRKIGYYPLDTFQRIHF